MAPFPDLNDTALFPAFADCPPEAASASSSSSAAAAAAAAVGAAEGTKQQRLQPQAGGREGGEETAAAGEGDWYLLAQIKDDMTIVKPTLVLSDRAGAPFAVIFEGWSGVGPGAGGSGLDLRARGLRKGATAVIPRARRVVPAEEGKREFVRVEKARADEVRAIPGPLERVLALATILGLGGEECGGGVRCSACGRSEEPAAEIEGGGRGGGRARRGLFKCTGCAGRARYCSKECQLKGWNELGHKTDCKIYKALGEIWR